MRKIKKKKKTAKNVAESCPKCDGVPVRIGIYLVKRIKSGKELSESWGPNQQAFGILTYEFDDATLHSKTAGLPLMLMNVRVYGSFKYIFCVTVEI